MFGGLAIKDNSDVFFKLKLPTSEIAAAVYLYSLFEHEFIMKVKPEDKWINFGRCYHKKITGDEGGASVIEFRSNLDEWHVTSEELMSLKDKSLTVIVKDISRLNIKYTESNKGDNENV